MLEGQRGNARPLRAGADIAALRVTREPRPVHLHDARPRRSAEHVRSGAELVRKLETSRLVAVVADSGSGKSSLVLAGLIPKFRGGVFADPMRRSRYVGGATINR